MAKSTTRIQSEEDGRWYILHETSVEKGETPICDGLAVPEINTFEDACELVDLGFFTEAEACKMLHDKWAIVEQQKARSKIAPKVTLSAEDMLTLYEALSPEDQAAYMAMTIKERLEFMKNAKREQAESKSITKQGILWVKPKHAAKKS